MSDARRYAVWPDPRSRSPPPLSFASIGTGWPRFTWKMAVKTERERERDQLQGNVTARFTVTTNVCEKWISRAIIKEVRVSGERIWTSADGEVEGKGRRIVCGRPHHSSTQAVFKAVSTLQLLSFFTWICSIIMTSVNVVYSHCSSQRRQLNASDNVAIKCGRGSAQACFRPVHHVFDMVRWKHAC